MARKMPKYDQYTIVEPSHSYSHSVSPYGQPAARPRHKLTSPAEIRDIAAAVGILSIAFYLILRVDDGRGVAYYAGLAVMSVVAGFFIHEMSHKAVARMYGCWAEFRADYRMLGFALLMSFFGFLFAAPGAVLIMGNIGPKENGKISLAGPGSNLLVALVCLPFWLFAIPGVPDLAANIASSLYFFSVFLGAFNMIPIMPFDGAKIWHWSKPVYIATLLAAGLMLFIALY
jgi:Zn-dependent protease